MGISPERWFSNKLLTDFFQVLTLTPDNNGKVFLLLRKITHFTQITNFTLHLVKQCCMLKWKPWNSYCLCFCRSGAFFFPNFAHACYIKRITKLFTCEFFLQISDVYLHCDESILPRFRSAMASRGTCNFTSFVSLKFSSGLRKDFTLNYCINFFDLFINIIYLWIPFGRKICLSGVMLKFLTRQMLSNLVKASATILSGV